MNYAKMSNAELTAAKTAFIIRGNMNAAREIAEFQEVFGKRVRVIKGRKVPLGTEGVVFWVKRYDNSKYGDPWGIYSNTRVGLKDDAGNTYFTAFNNVILI